MKRAALLGIPLLALLSAALAAGLHGSRPDGRPPAPAPEPGNQAPPPWSSELDPGDNDRVARRFKAYGYGPDPSASTEYLGNMVRYCSDYLQATDEQKQVVEWFAKDWWTRHYDCMHRVSAYRGDPSGFESVQRAVSDEHRGHWDRYLAQMALVLTRDQLDQLKANYPGPFAFDYNPD